MNAAAAASSDTSETAAPDNAPNGERPRASRQKTATSAMANVATARKLDNASDSFQAASLDAATVDNPNALLDTSNSTGTVAQNAAMAKAVAVFAGIHFIDCPMLELI